MTRSILTKKYKHLCHLLIQARESKGLTQARVAERLGRPQSFVSKYENGERRLDVIEFLEVTAALGVEAESLLAIVQDRSKTGKRETGKRDTILDRWKVSAAELTEVVDANPSLRGMMLGYLAEVKLRHMWFGRPEVARWRKYDDHDRRKKGDLVIVYKGKEFIVEAKSLQTNTIRHKEAIWSGKVQCDASDRRAVLLPNGKKIETTCLLVGEFDLLAVNLFEFQKTWRFVFAKNSGLPRSRYKKYTKAQRNCLLATLIDVTWPPISPFRDEPFSLLDEML